MNVDDWKFGFLPGIVFGDKFSLGVSSCLYPTLLFPTSVSQVVGKARVLLRVSENVSIYREFLARHR
jgi:hypothetical protein